MAENTFGMVSSTFVKAVHVQLADEGVDFVMSEVFGQDHLLEFIDVFDDELLAGRSPIGDFRKLLVLGKCEGTFKISNVLAMKPATSEASTS